MESSSWLARPKALPWSRCTGNVSLPGRFKIRTTYRCQESTKTQALSGTLQLSMISQWSHDNVHDDYDDHHTKALEGLIVVAVHVAHEEVEDGQVDQIKQSTTLGTYKIQLGVWFSRLSGGVNGKGDRSLTRFLFPPFSSSRFLQKSAQLYLYHSYTAAPGYKGERLEQHRSSRRPFPTELFCACGSCDAKGAAKFSWKCFLQFTQNFDVQAGESHPRKTPFFWTLLKLGGAPQPEFILTFLQK